MNEFSIRLPVRWGDMDAYGHVSNVVYLRYLEDARAHWFSSVPSRWLEGDKGPVVANLNIDFRRQLHWPAEIEITVVPQTPGRSSLRLGHEIRSLPEDGQAAVVYAEATSTMVWIDKRSGKSVPLPDVIRALAG